jgi:hypothetical protein
VPFILFQDKTSFIGLPPERKRRKKERNAFCAFGSFHSHHLPAYSLHGIRARTVIVSRPIVVNFTSTLLAMLRSLLVI